MKFQPSLIPDRHFTASSQSKVDFEKTDRSLDDAHSSASIHSGADIQTETKHVSTPNVPITNQSYVNPEQTGSAKGANLDKGNYETDNETTKEVGENWSPANEHEATADKNCEDTEKSVILDDETEKKNADVIDISLTTVASTSQSYSSAHDSSKREIVEVDISTPNIPGSNQGIEKGTSAQYLMSVYTLKELKEYAKEMNIQSIPSKKADIAQKIVEHVNQN